MQDIAGCRIVIPGIIAQNALLEKLTTVFESVSIMDRRAKPSHGYRAVHVIVTALDKQVEIQIRTPLQHLWAETSEKSSDILGLAVKYGGGDKTWQTFLAASSTAVKSFEAFEALHAIAKEKQRIALARHNEFQVAFDHFLKHCTAEQTQDVQHIREQLDASEKINVQLEEDVRRGEEKLEFLRGVNVNILQDAISILGNRKRQ